MSFVSIDSNSIVCFYVGEPVHQHVLIVLWKMSLIRPRLVTFDALGCLIRFRKPVAELYREQAKPYEKFIIGSSNLSPTWIHFTTHSVFAHDRFIKQEIDATKLERTFRSAFKNTYSKWPNFGATSSIPSSQWWVGSHLTLFRSLYFFAFIHCLCSRSQKLSIGRSSMPVIFLPLTSTLNNDSPRISFDISHTPPTAPMKRTKARKGP
jgi:hypothetical protein